MIETHPRILSRAVTGFDWLDSETKITLAAQCRRDCGRCREKRREAGTGARRTWWGSAGESPVGLGCSVKAEETRSKIWVQVVYGEVDPRKHSHLPTLSSETSP